MSPAASHYRLFGLHVCSEIALPELSPIAPGGNPDVHIRIARSEFPDSEASLVIEGTARFAVRNGNEIIVKPEPGVPERNVRLYLLGSAMGILLHQRRLLPLHANAIEIEGKAVAFMGPSGGGKSTLAAWFHDHGLRVIADDVLVIRFDEDGVAHASEGLPRLRLWKDVLGATGRKASDFERSYAGDDDWEKYDVPLARPDDGPGTFKLAAVFLLDRGDSFGVRQLTGVEATKAVFANTYRPEHVARVGDSRAYWEACVQLAKQTPLFVLERPLRFEDMDEQGEAILRHAQAIANLAE